jgi:chromosome segregation ATPase
VISRSVYIARRRYDRRVLTKTLTGKFKAVAAAHAAVRAAGDRTKKLQAVIEARDAEIGRLEELLSEEKASVAELRGELKQSEFQNGVLDTSYAKQLEEARVRAEKAEQTVEEQQARIDELEKAHHMLERELDSARARLDMIAPDDGASIDDLLATFSQPKDQTIAADKAAHVETIVEAQSSEEMLAPDVMFTKSGKR